MYEPSEPQRSKHPDQLDLDRLAEESVQVIEGVADDVFSDILELNGSSAGARLKVMVGVRDRKGQGSWTRNDAHTPIQG